MLNYYGGIFDCFYPGKGVVRTLVMAGTFTPDSLYEFTQKVYEEIGVQHEMSH